jgi:hypothetical protein
MCGSLQEQLAQRVETALKFGKVFSEQALKILFKEEGLQRYLLCSSMTMTRTENVARMGQIKRVVKMQNFRVRFSLLLKRIVYSLK